MILDDSTTSTPTVLVVDQHNLDVHYASPQAAAFLGLPAERLLGRSLMLSVPELGQALTLAISRGLGPQPVALNAVLSTDGQVGGATSVIAHARRRDGDILIELRPTSFGVPTTDDVRSPKASPLPPLQAIRQHLNDLRARIPCSEAMMRGDDPLLFLLWQAETSLARICERYPALFAPTDGSDPT